MTANGHKETAVCRNSESTSYEDSQIEERRKFKKSATGEKLSIGVFGLAPGHCRRKTKIVKIK